ncbi:MAG: ABC transporter permease [Chitinophagaceae bacterium]|nr:ABC transporter permease [Chitinophagaceae bacterium]
MLSLIKIEWLKIKKYPAFWWMLGIVALTYPGVNMMFHGIYDSMTSKTQKGGDMFKMLLGNPFAFPEAWHTVAYFSSWFLVVPAILVIMIISNEFTYKTNRQNIIDGWTRNEFILSKLFDVLIVAVVVTLAYTIIAVSFGFAYSTDLEKMRWIEEWRYIPLFLLQTFAQLSIAFLLGFLFKRSFIALGVFLFYFMILEPIGVGVIQKFSSFPSLASYLPLEISDKLIPPATFIGRLNKEAYDKNLMEINIHILYTCLLTTAIWGLCFYINRKRDL